ncbi:MAG: type II secretion system protein, partial [Pirellulales bacterium]
MATASSLIRCGDTSLRREHRSTPVSRGAPRGFTIIELLAAIAIIGFLAALLVGAVQHSREASRRAQCANRLRQIGIALAQYQSAFGCLPPGCGRASFLVAILPAMDLDTVAASVGYGTAHPAHWG